MRKWRKLSATYNSFPISADTGLEPAVLVLESAGEACLPEANWDGLTNKGDEPRRPAAGCDWLDGLLVLDLGGGVFLKTKEECDCYLSKSGYQNRQQCRRILGGRKRLVYVSTVEGAIFDFMTEEDWGEFSVNIRVAPFPLLFWSFKMALPRAKTFTRPKETPALQASINMTAVKLWPWLP